MLCKNIFISPEANFVDSGPHFIVFESSCWLWKVPSEWKKANVMPILMKGRKKYWRVRGWSASPWFPGRSWRILRMITNSLGRHFQIRQRQEDDWKQPAKIQKGQIMLHHSDWILWLVDWLSGWRGSKVICLDLNRAFDMVSHSCGILLGKWERDGVVV